MSREEFLTKRLAERGEEVERLRALIEDGCKVFEHYDLPEHALHYRRTMERSPQQRVTGSEK